MAALGLCLPLSLAGANAALGAVTLALILGLRDEELGAKLKTRLTSIFKEPVFLAGLAYVAASLLSGLLGAGPASSLRLWPKDLHKLWVLAAVGAAMGGSGRRGFCLGLAAGASAAALVGIGQSLYIDTGLGFYSRARAFVHPVVYGEMTGLCLLGAVILYGRSEAGAQSPRARQATTALACLLAVALLLNQTRAALAAVLAGFILLGFVEPAWRKRTAATLLCGALVICLWERLPTGGRTVESIFVGGAGEPHRMRLTLWSVAWRMFRDHPWTGAGPGHYQTLFTRYFQGLLDGQPVWSSAHNLFLHQMAERGLLGLAALLAFLGTLSVSAWKRSRLKPDGWTFWALSVTMAFLVMNVTETAFQTEQAATLFLAIWTLGQARPGDEFL